MIDKLKIIRIIQSNERYDSCEAEYEGRRVFAKKAKSQKTRELLARVPENSAAANRMGHRSAFRFRSPQIYEQTGDWLVTEWIDGDSLGEKVDARPEAAAETLASFLLVLDQEPVGNQEVRKTFASASLAAYMKEKLPKNLSPEQNKILVDAKNTFDQLQTTLTASWQDGDIKPDHIFIDPKIKGGFVLVDPEHLDQRWPRFYSLANNFSKYWVRGPQQFSKALVELFMNKSGASEEEFFRPFLACVIVRGISLHWEPDYDPGAESYNIPRAQEMLKTCLAINNIDDLLY